MGAAGTIGVQYNRARWLTEGPLRLGGGDANLYRYVGNSRPNATDPTGTTSGGLVTLGTTLVGAGIGFVSGGLSADGGWAWDRAWAGAIRGNHRRTAEAAAEIGGGHQPKAGLPT